MYVLVMADYNYAFIIIANTINVAAVNIARSEEDAVAKNPSFITDPGGAGASNLESSCCLACIIINDFFILVAADSDPVVISCAISESIA